MNIDTIAKFAPAIINTTAVSDKCSDKYNLIPTSAIIESMIGAGFHPTQALQARKDATGRHIVRFTHESQIAVDGDRPEIVLVNSHDGRSSYRLMSGIFRFICSNGLIVQDNNFGEHRICHKGTKSEIDQVIAASLSIVDNTMNVIEATKAMKSLQLSDKQREQFALYAAQMRFSAYGDYEQKALDAIYKEAGVLLTPRRDEDSDKSLWTTYNVIQENVIKGGVKLGRRAMRPVNNVRKNVLYNTQLWAAASQLSENKELVLVA